MKKKLLILSLLVVCFVFVGCDNNKVQEITYDLNGGSFEETSIKTFIKKELPFALPSATKEGHTFSGWYGSSDFAGAVISNISEVKDYTLYAKWTINTFTVSFMGADGAELISGEETQTINYGTAATAPVYEKLGYNFTGWDKEFSSVKEDLTVTAQWSIKEFTVSFNGADGGVLLSGEETSTVDYGSTCTAPVYEKTGYNFSGWDKDFSSVEEDMIITAEWAIKEFTVSFNGADGGVLLSGEESQTIDYGSAALAPVYEKTGYNFIGWDKDFSSVEEDMTITAEWSIKTFTVTFNGADGGMLLSGEAVQIINYGSAALAPVYEKEGYDLTGWDKDFSSVEEDMTITAQWVLIPGTVGLTYSFSELGYTVLNYTGEATEIVYLLSMMMVLTGLIKL